MTVEERARIIIERELRREVVLHDDGSEPGMYDLRVGERDTPEIAIECVGAVDPEWTETWNVGPARGAWRLDLSGDWRVVLRLGARVKKVRHRIQAVLRGFEDRGVRGFVPVDFRLKRAHPDLAQELLDLEIDSINRYRVLGKGDVSLGLTGTGGPVDRHGLAVPSWIVSFLGATERKDVLAKLRRSGAGECHVYVPVAPLGVPWAVESYLSTDTARLPSETPMLPSPISRVWITYGVTGLRWDGQSWGFFDALVPLDDRKNL